MKVALCFSGGIRNFKDNFESIRNCLIEPLNADVFIHGWYFKVDELDNKHKMYRKEETPQNKVIILAKPKKYKFEVYNKEKELEITKKFKIEEVKKEYEANEYLCQLYPNTCGMFWSIYQANELKKQYEEKNDFKYDIVIRCRPDFEYYTKLNFDILKLVDNKNTILLPLDNYAFLTQQCDKFAIGSSEVMDYYAELQKNMLEYVHKYPDDFWDGPKVLKKHLSLKDVKTKWIYYDYDYHVRRKSQRLTEDKRKKLDYDRKNNLVIKPKKFNNI